MYKSILLPVDLGEADTSLKAMKTSVEMARLWGAALHIVSVLPNFGMPVVGGFFPKDFEVEAMDKMKTAIAEYVSSHIDDDIEVKAHVAHGTIYEEIIKAAAKLNCEVIVISAHRPELKDYLLGPNASRVVRHVDCSVMVVRE